MSLWEYSFELVTRELDLTKKKKEALDNLFASNKISQSTHDYLEKELKEAISELEDYLKTLMDKMTARAQELEKQVGTLELFLASLEIHHAAGDVDDETYEKQNKAILLGLEATKQELSDIKNSLSKAVTEAAEVPAEPSEPVETTAETTEATEVTEPVKEEEAPPVEEPPAYEPTESVESSQETAAESTVTEPAETEAPSLAPYSEDVSEEPSSESETTSEY